MNKTENSKMRLIDFCDLNKIPYIKIKILFNYKDKLTNKTIKKKPFYIPFKDKKSGNYVYVKNETFDSKWMDWDYDKCKIHNEFISKNKMGLNAVNINLTNSKYMIVDIDSENPEQVKQYLEEYGDIMKTKSTGRKLPHLWRLKHEEDFNTTKTKYKEELDLIYTNTFEFIDTKFENYTEDIPIFKDFPKIEKKPKKKIIIKKPKQITKPKTKPNSDEILQKQAQDLGFIDEHHLPITGKEEDYQKWLEIEVDMPDIPDSGNEEEGEEGDIKTEELLNIINPNCSYDEWLKICFALKNDNPNNFNIFKKWCSKYTRDNVLRNTEHGLKETWDNAKEGVTLGTLHYYAKLYNEFEYRKFMIKQGINISDDALAKLYINLQYNNIVFSNDEVYLYKKNWVKDHKKHLQLKKDIRVVLQEYYLKVHIDISKKMIELINDEGQVKIIKEKLKSIALIIEKCSSKKAIDNIKDFIIQDLSTLNRNIIFDLGQEQIYNLQFKNGVYEMNNKKFRKRTQNDYITQYLDWDYNPEVDKEKLKEVELIYKKLQPLKEQRKFSLEWMAYNLTGSTGKQKFKMNIGYSAGNGKSTEFKIHDRVFDIYSKKLDNITFNLKNDKRHKQIIHLLKNPIRFAYCEELQQSKLDVNFIKDFVDGSKITCEIMYGTSQSASIQSKLNTCSNADFNIDLDKGILRRGLVQFYESKFRDEYKEDNYENNTYKLIEDMEDIFLQEEYKNAYLHLLLNHYDKDFKAPSKNKDAFKEIANEYDEYGTILTDDFIITDDKKDCISKETLHNYFKDKLNKKSMSWRFFLTQMKNKDIKYNKSRMIKGERGQFEGIKYNENPAEDEDEDDELDN